MGVFVGVVGSEVCRGDSYYCAVGSLGGGLGWAGGGGGGHFWTDVLFLFG